LLRGNPDIFMNHHFYQTDLPRKTFVGVTSIFPNLCALGGPLLRIVMEYLEITFSGLVFRILSRCERGSIAYHKVFRELLSLINEKRVGRRLVRQLVEFAFAHVHALQPKIRMDRNGTNGTEKLMCLNDGVTVFRRTFDIPSVLERIDNRTGSWRSMSTKSTAYSFVVYPRQTTYESKTLRIGDKVAEILRLLKRPQREEWILGKFPSPEAGATSAAINDLFRRGVLRECTETDPRFVENDVLLDRDRFC
jgi:hypothetical protein